MRERSEDDVRRFISDSREISSVMPLCTGCLATSTLMNYVLNFKSRFFLASLND